MKGFLHLYSTNRVTKQYWVLGWLLAATLWSSCKSSVVSLVDTNAESEVPLLGNLRFQFSKSMVGDSLLNRWDSTEYVVFKPAIRGKFRWERPDELVFSPALPLQPATAYSAKLQSARLLKNIRNVRSITAKNLSFHTPFISITEASGFWNTSIDGKQLFPQFDLYFNYSVNPEKLMSRLTVKYGGTKLTVEPLTKSAADKISFRVIGLKLEDLDYEFSIQIAKGLLPEKGNLPTEETLAQSINLGSPFLMAIRNISSEHNGSEGTIRISTNQQVDPAQIAQFIQIEPKLSFSISTQLNEIAITSNLFSMDNSYSLLVKKGLKGKLGGVLKNDYREPIAFGSLEPAINFTASKAMYLGKQGAKNMEVQISSIEKIKLTISKVYENNLLAAQQYGYYPPDQEMYRDEYGNNEFDQSVLGDIIYETEIPTSSLPKKGRNSLIYFNPADKIPQFNGIYHIQVRSTTDYWIGDSRFVALTDMGLMARQGNKTMLVFANSLQTAAPIPNAQILVYGNNNQLLGKGSTAESGVATIPLTRQEYAGFKPALIIARTEKDFSYLPFQQTAVNTSRFETGGKHNNATGLDVFLYGERELYRPGEQINLAAMVRTRQGQVPDQQPFTFKVNFPDGKEMLSLRRQLGAEGLMEANIPIPAASVTGTYLVQLFNGSQILIASKPIRVETFMPDRIKLDARLNRTSGAPGDLLELNLYAQNYFGPPAAKRKYETEIQIAPSTFTSSQFHQFRFDLNQTQQLFDKMLKQGVTNDSGTAKEGFLIPELYANSGLLKAKFYTTIFDETGRPVSRVSTADIYTQPVFFGLGDGELNYVPLNRALRLPLIALNKKGEAVSAEAMVQVIKDEYRTTLVRSGSYFRYESNLEQRIVASEKVVIAGTHSVYAFTPTSPGDYELRVLAPGSKAYVSQRFYSYGAWGNQGNFEVNREGQVDIALSKDKYEAGETAQILFKAPFNGRLLVTVETDEVIKHEYLNVVNRTASLQLPIDKMFVPNVFVTATLFKPHQVSDMPLTVAYGYKNLKVQDADRKLKVQIDAPAISRSARTQIVRVNTAPHAAVTLAVVDNGILAVTNYVSPDPYEYFSLPQALNVQAYNMYPLLFPEINKLRSSTGGDASSLLDQRQNPMPDKRVKLLSYWSGIKTANAMGVASFELQLPRFNGQLRLMAVAAKRAKSGSAEARMIVADPVVISSGLPRFMSPGDTLLVPINLTNNTKSAADLITRIQTSSGISVLGANQTSTPVAAGKEGQTTFQLVAPPTIGLAKITMQVMLGKETFTEETDITIRPTAPLQHRSQSLIIPAGQTQTLRLDAGDFLPSSLRYSITLSRHPFTSLGMPLQFLVQYPYGCTEQVISAAFPQLYYTDMRRLAGANHQLEIPALYNINEAIRQIKMRQLYNGAVTLWENESEASWWTTAFAAHFCWEAKKAGYEVDQSLLETLMGYLNDRLRSKELIDYRYNRNQQRRIAPKEIAYSLYVLALANRPNRPSMNYYKGNLKDLALDSRYLLSAAFAIAGDRKSFAQLLPTAFVGEEAVPQTGGSFSSGIRDEAVALSALVDVNPSHPQVPVMARHITDQLNMRSWYSTQECAFSFVALGKLARLNQNNKSTANLVVAGKLVASMTGEPVSVGHRQLNSLSPQVITSGNGQVYVWWQTEGISAGLPVPETDQYLRVRRNYYDRFGRPIINNRFKQNDLIVVKLTVEKAYAGSLDNVVVTDLLPAGFEIENSRLKDVPGMEWVQDASLALHTDIRDDRIHFFSNLNGPQRFYYTVRAVSTGSFKLGPASAEAMYNAEYRSYNGSGRVWVSR